MAQVVSELGDWFLLRRYLQLSPGSDRPRALTLALCSFAAGLLANGGTGVRPLSYATGGLMIVPAVLWLAA
jgi:hypothetical protein